MADNANRYESNPKPAITPVAIALRDAAALVTKAGIPLIEVHISNIRCKLDRPFGTRSLRTVRGAGYVLKE